MAPLSFNPFSWKSSLKGEKQGQPQEEPHIERAPTAFRQRTDKMATAVYQWLKCDVNVESFHAGRGGSYFIHLGWHFAQKD